MSVHLISIKHRVFAVQGRMDSRTTRRHQFRPKVTPQFRCRWSRRQAPAAAAVGQWAPPPHLLAYLTAACLFSESEVTRKNIEINNICILYASNMYHSPSNLIRNLVKVHIHARVIYITHLH